MATELLALSPSPHREVFRVLVDTLRADPVLASVVRTWRAYEGRPDDTAELAASQTPCVWLTPQEGADDWYGPSGLIGPLVVLVEVYAPGTDADDILDLWYAIKRAVYPADATACLAIHSRLVAAGAEGHYLAEFTPARFGPVEGEDANFLAATGMIRVRCRAELNP
jgi:hypothetical protein